MRHDAIELRRSGLAARAAEDRVARLATRLTSFAEAQADAGGVDVIDAAFAKLAGTNSRVTRIDTGSAAATAPAVHNESELKSAAGWEHFKQEISADLSAQLSALDCQRERLAALLRSIDRDAVGPQPSSIFPTGE